MNKTSTASGRRKKVKAMTRANFLPFFFAHLAFTLVAACLLLPIGDYLFQSTPPSVETYFCWGTFWLAGFPLLDVSLLHIKKDVELGDTLGVFWLLLVPINSAIVALLLLGVRQAWQKTAMRRKAKRTL